MKPQPPGSSPGSAPGAPTTRTDEASIRYRWRVFTLAALFFALLLPRIGSGTLYQHDEIFTANRAREILVRADPWTITRNFVPDFRKPPLQYWVTAALLPLMPNRPEVAVRLPSLLAGTACLLALAWVATLGYGAQGPRTGLLAALALAGCGYFVHSARIGLLDTGAALLVLLAVAGCQLARRDGRWWWFVGAVCVLGAWQKAPFGFAAWTIILLVRFLGGEYRARIARATLLPHLPGALVASLLVTSLWWLLQIHLHGLAALRDAGNWQTQALAVAHDPGDTGFRPWVYWFWLTRDWAVPGLLAPVMLVGVLRRRWQLPVSSPVEGSTASALSTASFPTPTAEIAWVCAVFALALVLVPYRAERYLVVFTPLLALLLVRWLLAVAASSAVPTALRRFVLPVALLSTLPVALFHYLNQKPVRADLLAASHLLARSLRPGETPVVFTDPFFEVAGFVSFYGNLPRPLLELPSPTALPGAPLPQRGLCRRRQVPDLARLAAPKAQVTSLPGDWSLWSR